MQCDKSANLPIAAGNTLCVGEDCEFLDGVKPASIWVRGVCTAVRLVHTDAHGRGLWDYTVRTADGRHCRVVVRHLDNEDTAIRRPL